MISLPPALSPWSSQLAAFPAEISLALGPLVQRMAAAIDPLRVEEIPGQDDPDGFDGLVNRGSYERLIASEWLLAEEIPEEFERRASMSEHLFLKTAKLDRAHGLGSVVLFDAGPDQIGSPRVAHLAALIVLIRRAERANANFAWGILQRPESPLLNGSGESQILKLLRARSFLQVTQKQLDEWVHKALETNRPEEVWLVGGGRLQQMSPPHLVSRINVEDVFEPGERQVSVEIYRAKGKPRKVLLTLPSEGACAQLLRDPFQARASAAAKVAFADSLSDLVFGPGGGHLFAMGGDKTLFSFVVPNQPRDTEPKMRRNTIDGAGVMVAVNRVGRSTAVITLEPGVLHLSYIGKQTNVRAGNYKLPNEFTWPAYNEAGLLMPCVRPAWAVPSGPCLLVLDAAGNLFRLTDKPGGNEVTLLESSVLALSNSGHVFNKAEGTISHRYVRPGSDEPETNQNLSLAEQVFIGFGADVPLPHCLCAVKMGPLNWQIRSAGKNVFEIEVAADQDVVGVIQQKSHADSLVVLQEHRHSVGLKGSSWERTLFESDDPIVHFTVSQDQPWFAFSTSKGDVTVYSLTLGKNLCRFVNRRNG